MDKFLEKCGMGTVGGLVIAGVVLLMGQLRGHTWAVPLPWGAVGLGLLPFALAFLTPESVRSEKTGESMEGF